MSSTEIITTAIKHRPLPQGLMVTLEGMDGCGKTTQALHLVNLLREVGYEVLHVKEPGGAVDADKVRKLLLHDLSDDAHGGVEAMLFMAAKIDLFQRVVKPALERGAIVVSERGWYSMFAYQGEGHQMGTRNLKRLRDACEALGAPSIHQFPSLQILLRQSVEVSQQRIAQRNEKLDHFETKPVEFYERVRAQFDRDFAYETARSTDVDALRERRVIIRANQEKHVVAAEVYGAVRKHLNYVADKSVAGV